MVEKLEFLMVVENSSQQPNSISLFPLGRRTIGRYELLSPLASGGMAAVFLGRLSGMAGFEKLVAIKIVHPHLAEQAEFVEMFLDEARLSAKIHHPNAVEIFEVGEEHGLYFMVVELVQGKSLDEIVDVMDRAGKRLDSRFFLTMLAKVCDALEAAHNLKTPGGAPLNLVHRDISPSNILISYDGFVKLIDFGIAYAQERIASTRSGVVKGKFGYMAPEQVQGKQVDRRTDIFALGVVLYLLATGRHPFPGDTQIERVSQILQGCPEQPKAIMPGIDPALDRAIMRALSDNPAARQQTAKELGLELRALLSPLGGMVESTDIAPLMSALFAEDIAEDTKTIERAAGGHEEDAASSPQGDSEKFRNLKPPGDSRAGGHTPLEKQGGASTKQIDYLKSKSSRRWKRLLVPVAAGLGGVAAVVLSYMEPALVVGADERLVQDIRPEDSRPEDIRPAPADDATKDVLTVEEQPPPPPIHKKNETSVELRLKGLPPSATLLLDGQKMTAVDGKITVPKSGEAVELVVLAEGYLPYQEVILAEDGGEIVVDLKKKRALPIHKKKKNKEKNQKGKSSTLMDCPFCKK